MEVKRLLELMGFCCPAVFTVKENAERELF
jgi:hypothetical protein